VRGPAGADLHRAGGTRGDRQPHPVAQRHTLSQPGRDAFRLAERLREPCGDRAGKQLASVDLIGLASHVRWAGTENEIVFTLGHYGANYVVLHNLYVWDLTNGKAPSPLTSDNTSRAAEWLGVPQAWLP
jgi:hypothetical protein